MSGVQKIFVSILSDTFSLSINITHQACLLRKKHDLATMKLKSVQQHVATIEADVESNDVLGPKKLNEWRTEEKQWVQHIASRTDVTGCKNPYASDTPTHK